MLRAVSGIVSESFLPNGRVVHASPNHGSETRFGCGIPATLEMNIMPVLRAAEKTGPFRSSPVLEGNLPIAPSS